MHGKCDCVGWTGLASSISRDHDHGICTTMDDLRIRDEIPGCGGKGIAEIAWPVPEISRSRRAADT